MERFWKGVRKRAKNYGLWISMFALTFMILSDAGVVIDAGRYDTYVDLAMGILIAAGVVSDPRAGKWFKDPKQDEGKDLEDDK